MSSAEVRRDVLKRLIDERGLNAAQLADRARVSKGTLSNFFSGRSRSLRQDTLEKVAFVLQVPVSTLIVDASLAVDEPARPGKVSSLSDEDIMNLQLMVQLLRQIAEQQAETTRAIISLEGTVRAALSDQNRQSR